MDNNLSLLVAVWGGVLSFVSPCVLPLVPAYFAILVSSELPKTKTMGFQLPLVLNSIVFVAGFTIVFVGLGALAGWAGFTFGTQVLTRKIAGCLLIGLGLFMLLAIKVPWLNFEKHLTPIQTLKTGYLRSFLIGTIFAFAWTPCAGPILGGILALAMQSNTAWNGAYLLFFYSMGIALPFLILGIAFDFLIPLFKQIRKYANVIYMVSGLLLIITGVLTLKTVLV